MDTRTAGAMGAKITNSKLTKATRSKAAKKGWHERDYHAKLVVHDIAELSTKDIKRLQTWLMLLSKGISEAPKEYANRFTAKLMK